MAAMSDVVTLESVFFWAMAAVGTVATLYTVLFSEDRELKSSALFNLLSFIVTTIAVIAVVNKFKPDYSVVKQWQSNWIPFEGANLILYFLFADLIFYLYHRVTHAIPFFWLGHFSHHSGSHLHLSLIIRDNVLAHVATLPIGLLGIPFGLSPAGLVIFIRLILLYQSFLHFKVSKDIPFVNLLFVTPYNHIIHHSMRHEGYGQNFGGILNIWDRICGTYREGDEYLEAFGVAHVKNPNSLWSLNVVPIKTLLLQCFNNRSLKPLLFFDSVTYRSPRFGKYLYFFCFLLCLDILRRAVLS
jgi:sterol desaturase/sphingolipid hydroxylase (fatty acid hydroxylase superfamily)